jgi:hypothetical protein
MCLGATLLLYSHRRFLEHVLRCDFDVIKDFGFSYLAPIDFQMRLSKARFNNVLIVN